jgi:RNA polymerase sigma-54 factor
VKSLEQRATTILKVAGRDRAPPGRLLPPRRRASPPADPARRGGGGRDARKHRSAASPPTSTSPRPRGTFELKYFFTTAIAGTAGGEAHSAESVRFRIREMVAARRPDDILSDDAIVERLRKEGVDIARRTVAKYREALRIPSSVQRKREKAVRPDVQGP